MNITKTLRRNIFLCALTCAVAACSSMRSTPAGSAGVSEKNLKSGEQVAWSFNQLKQNGADTRAQFKWRGRPANQVAPGYEVELVNPADAQLNGRFRIRFDGVLELPYSIRVNTTGSTEAQMKQKILSAYSNFFQTAPTMQINVVDKKYYVDVRGLVNKPGQYLVRSDSSLDELISAAGGLQASLSKDPNAGAAARFVRVNQGNDTEVINLADYYAGTQSLNPVWQGGEVVFFQSERGDTGIRTDGLAYIQALGQVRSPGEYQWREGADYLYYIVKAGGPTDRANLNRVQIIRVSGGQAQYMLYDLMKDEDRAAMPAIQPGDVLLVNTDGETPPEREARYWSQIATIFTSLATIAILALTL